MKKVIYALLGLVVLLVIAVIAAPFLIPAERLKEELILAVNDATGRTLAIDGEIGVSVFPTLGVQASKVSLSNAPSSDTPNMATFDNLTIKLAVLPLLTGQVQVNKFVLDKPVINLEVDKSGKANWDFGSATAPSESTSATDKAASSSDSSGLGIRDLNLGDVQIIGGALTYTDQKSGDVQKVSDINLGLVLEGLDNPFIAKGSVVWNKEKLDFDTTIGKLSAVLENKPSTLASSLQSTKVTLKLDGDLASTQPLSLTGKTDLSVPSVKELIRWTGTAFEARENTFEAMSIKGNLKIEDTQYAFKNASLAFDKINGDGDFLIKLGGKIPYLEGRLNIVELDVNPYMPEGSQQSPSADKGSSSGQQSNQKWDDTPIDFSGLKAANAKFDLTVGSLLIQEIKIGKSNIKTNLKNGVLDVALTELALYEGKGSGAVKIDARTAQAKVSKNFSLSGLQLNPLLNDAADFDKLEGTGKIDIAINTVGQSQKDFVEALNGNGKILFENGAIKGINLAAMARNVTSAFTDKSGSQKTDFAELSGTYTITNGLLKNTDLKMLNPFIRVTGAGDVDMPPKTLDYRVEPKVVASTEGQGGKDASGLVVPIKISGSWDNPKFAPDLAGVIGNVADPKKLKEKGKEELNKAIEKNLGDKVGKSLGGFLGKKKD
ncbi:MAG: AsmA family protein [Sneathiellales bacterium]|nr:AsmA family protein [Sneathiellales bacterium]